MRTFTRRAAYAASILVTFGLIYWQWPYQANNTDTLGVITQNPAVNIGGTKRTQTANPRVIVDSNDLDIDVEAKKILRKMIDQGKTVLITFINDGFLPFANSWLCNTMFMGIHDQILLFATDLKSKDALAKFWPQVNVISMAEESLSGNQDYQHAGYLRFMVKRTRWIKWMLDNNVEFLLFEFDFVWFVNPLPEVRKKSENHDIVLIHVALHPTEACGCFIFIKPTPKAKLLWNELTRKMNEIEKKMKNIKNDQEVPFYENDQSYLTHLAGQGFGGVRIGWMPYSQFPDGKWFEMKEAERVKTFNTLVLHNNWIIGNQKKMDRAKRFNLWFWNSESQSCDAGLVKHYTSQNFTNEMIHKITPKS